MSEDLQTSSGSFSWDAYSWLTDDNRAKLAQLAEEFRYWNARINLVSRKEIDLLEARHLLPCAAIAQVAKWNELKTHLDIGTGGGLPGLIIACLFPHLKCTLLDSTAKKLKAIAHMAEMLALDNVQVVHERIEQHRAHYDIITGRAVTALPRFLAWAQPHMAIDGKNAGVYYWKGGAFEPEIEAMQLEPDQVYSLSDYLPDPYFEDKFIAYYKASRLVKSKPLKTYLK